MKHPFHSKLILIASVFIAQTSSAHAETIQLSTELRTEIEKRGGDLRNEVVAPAATTGTQGVNPGDEILVSGKYIGKGDQVLQLRDEAANVTYLVNFPRTMELVPPNDQQIEVHGKVEVIDLKNRKITIRGLQVDVPEATTHSH